MSVTDRCNLRCQYCMPEQDYVWLPRSDILTFEETGFLVDVFSCGKSAKDALMKVDRVAGGHKDDDLVGLFGFPGDKSAVANFEGEFMRQYPYPNSNSFFWFFPQHPCDFGSSF